MRYSRSTLRACCRVAGSDLPQRVALSGASRGEVSRNWPIHDVRRSEHGRGVAVAGGCVVPRSKRFERRGAAARPAPTRSAGRHGLGSRHPTRVALCSPPWPHLTSLATLAPTLAHVNAPAPGRAVRSAVRPSKGVALRGQGGQPLQRQMAAIPRICAPINGISLALHTSHTQEHPAPLSGRLGKRAAPPRRRVTRQC